jgi:tRNA acetyltransferase TAN1
MRCVYASIYGLDILVHAHYIKYAGRFYGDDTAVEKEDEKILDIESSIQKEVASVGLKEGLAKLFTPVFLDLPCVLFFKTRQPVEPVDFVHKICIDAAEQWTIRRHRFVNRLTPVTMTGKATEKGLEEVGRNVLREHFRLTEGEADQIGGEGADERKSSVSKRSSSTRISSHFCGGSTDSI